MGDVMCIVSKAIFEKAAGKKPSLGTVLGMDRYHTANKALAPLADGGKLYLVTVRPPDEELWLVAVLENPEFDGEEWSVETACTTPLTDISELRAKIKFTSGKGISAASGTLGMSLQTPRELTPEDAELIDALLPHAEKPNHDDNDEGFPEPPEAIPANTGERKVGDALVQAIIDEPFGDLPRQVFADAQATRNDPRGEFVTLEIALAGPLSIRHRDHMKARRDELFAEHREAWFPTALEYRTRGGFIAAITGPFDKLQQEAATLFSTQPITEVAISSIDPVKLAKAPWLRHIRHLIIRSGIGGAKGVAAIVSSPNAQQLTDLNVTSLSLDAAALQGLKANLPALRSLVLTGNGLGTAGIAALLAWKHLSNLETLYLSKCDLTSADVAALLAKPLPNLAKLTLAGNKLDATIGKLLAKAAPNVPKLEQLELAGNKKLDATVLEDLGKAKFTAIRRIDLRQTKVKLGDVAELPLFRAGA